MEAQESTIIGNDGRIIRYRDIAGSPDYRVGTDGTVWSCRTYSTNNGRQPKIWRQLKVNRQKKGSRYCVVLLRPGPGRKPTLCPVHRLVLEAFVGPRPEGMECCHNDGDTGNNQLENLRWDTRKANRADMKRHGTHLQGDRCPWAKVTEADVVRIHEMRRDGTSQADIARIYSVNPSTVRDILSGRNWQHVKAAFDANFIN